MADAVQLSEFRTRVRYAADIEVGASSSRFPDAELDRYINEACKALYNKLVRARGEDYYVTSSALVCVPGTTNYNLPADFAWLVSVIGYDGASEYTELHPMDLHGEYVDTLNRAGGLNASYIGDMRYKLWGSTLYVEPPPSSASWRIYLHYVPTMTEMSLATDSFDGINGFEQWAVLTAAIHCKAKDEEDPSALMAERAMIDQTIEHLASQRDAGRPARIIDTKRDYAVAPWTRGGLGDDWDW